MKKLLLLLFLFPVLCKAQGWTKVRPVVFDTVYQSKIYGDSNQVTHFKNVKGLKLKARDGSDSIHVKSNRVVCSGYKIFQKYYWVPIPGLDGVNKQNEGKIVWIPTNEYLEKDRKTKITHNVIGSEP